MGYAGFKAAVLALLAGNTAWYVATGTPSEALDAVAWLILLASFEIETRCGGRFRGAIVPAILRAVRGGAALAIAAAIAGYIGAGEWLDTVNLALWIAVVVLLEIELRRPRSVAAHRKAHSAVAAALYGGLALVILAWAARGEWFDAWDALLWLVAFASIEIDVFRSTRPATDAARSG